jgi:drug/metabolite transporter (DMT)-like permease
MKVKYVVIGFGGIIVINLKGLDFNMNFTGDAFVLFSAISSATSTVLMKLASKHEDPVIISGYQFLAGGAVMALVGLAMGGSVIFRWDASLWIMAYICIASIVSYCIWFGIVKNGELSKLFIIKFAEPVFACVFGALILDENIWKIQYLLAFLLISGSIWFSNTKIKKGKVPQR